MNNKRKNSLWTSLSIAFFFSSIFLYSPLSASCFDASLFIWFKLDNNSRLSCLSRLLNRTIFFLLNYFLVRTNSVSLMMIDFSSAKRKKIEKKNSNFYFSSTFIFFLNPVFCFRISDGTCTNARWIPYRRVDPVYYFMTRKTIQNNNNDENNRYPFVRGQKTHNEWKLSFCAMCVFVVQRQKTKRTIHLCDDCVWR